MTSQSELLAIDGGQPVTKDVFPEPWLGPAAIAEEEIQAVTDVLRSRRLFRHLDPENSYCTKLENQFRTFTGSEYALAVGGGTAALICALIGIGIGDGDEVIVPGYTYIASAAAVIIAGGVPVIAEIDETLTLDPTDIERNITSRTKAIMPVHMRGIPCDMDRIMAIAKQHNLIVIEDCAQACGGLYKGRALGSIGDVGCFSLQQYKIITTGEGGMIVTNRREVYERAAIRHDSAMCFWNPNDTTVTPFAGENFRMSEMEGALGYVQFGRLASILGRTRELKARILNDLRDVQGLKLHDAPDPAGDCGITVAFLLETGEKAKRFAEAMHAEGIPAGSMYDKGIPDRHIYCYWEYVMEKHSADAHGRPWTSPLHDQNRTYRPDMCPHTLNILGRTVTIALAQTFTDQHAEWIVTAAKKVARTL